MQQIQTIISKPTIIEGIVGFIMSLTIANEYKLLNIVPLYISVPIIMIMWNYPIMISYSKRKFYVTYGWEDHNNTDIKK